MSPSTPTPTPAVTPEPRILDEHMIGVYQRTYDLEKISLDPEHTDIEWGDAASIHRLCESHEALRSLLSDRDETIKRLEAHVRALQHSLDVLEQGGF